MRYPITTRLFFSIRKSSFLLFPRSRNFLALRWLPPQRSAVTSASTRSTSLIQELKDRSLVESITGVEGQLDSLVSTQPVVVYGGVDPTASSLHVGHLLPLMNLLHFYLHGHHSIALIGKSTALVGDPSGRSTERESPMSEWVRNSFESLQVQLNRFFEGGRSYALSRGYDGAKFGKRELVTNSEWLEGIGLVEFLGTVGRHVRVGQMLARESVKARMESSQGINYAEFTYQLLQSYDFWHLSRTRSCRVQIGGNDQYGNITAGIDLISRLRKANNETQLQDNFDPAYGLTVPLLTTPSGEKFGKSAGNAVWLDEKLTTPFDLYQYFIKIPDQLVETYLKTFTLLPLTEIGSVIQKHANAPEPRSAQRLLAKEVVTLVHGEAKASRAEIQTQLLFPTASSKIVKFSALVIRNTFMGDEQMIDVPREELVGNLVSKVMRRVGAVKTRSEAENIIKSGGVYYGQEGNRIQGGDVKVLVQQSWLLDGEILLLKIGKGKSIVIRAV